MGTKIVAYVAHCVLGLTGCPNSLTGVLIFSSDVMFDVSKLGASSRQLSQDLLTSPSQYQHDGDKMVLMVIVSMVSLCQSAPDLARSYNVENS